MMRKIRPTHRALLIGVVAFTLAAAALYFSVAYGSTQKAESTPSASEEAQTQTQVKTVNLREGTLPITIHSIGRIVSLRQKPASLTALAAGTVTRIPVYEGDRVTSGTVLIQMDERAARAELRKLRTDVALAEKELDYGERKGLSQELEDLELAANEAQVHATQARRESGLQEELYRKQLTSEKAATEAHQEAETAEKAASAAQRKVADFKQSGQSLDLDRLRSKVEEAQTALKLAELDAGALTVRAPLDGRVTRLHVAVGQSVDKGANLIDLETVGNSGVEFALPPDQAASVKAGMSFTLRDLRGSRDWTGTIATVGAALNPDTGLIGIEGNISSAEGTPFLGEALPGEITLRDSPKGLIVPLPALCAAEDGNAVYRIDEKNCARRVTAEVLARDLKEAVIQAKGLEPGQKVIIDGGYNLPEGASVAVEGER